MHHPCAFQPDFDLAKMPHKRRKLDHRVPKAEGRKQTQSELAVVPNEIRSLVCERCWTDFFEAPECWVFYDEDHEAGPINSQYHTRLPRASCRASRSHVAENAGTCNWCSLISWELSWLDERYPDWKECTDLSVLLKPSDCRGDPEMGRNTWKLLIRPHDQPLEELERQGIGAVLHACASSEDRAAKLVTIRPVQTEVDTDQAYKEIKTWLRACKLHPGCPTQRKVRFPTRVIDVGSRVNSVPKLYITKGAAGRYAALSYCWGGPQDGALTRDNLQRSLKAFDMESISQTIKEAIKVVRAVGLRYLWVDALCILQDSDDDKTREIANMDQVYSKALFTISAEMASSARDSFLSAREPQLATCKIPLRFADGTFGSMFLNGKPSRSGRLFQPLQNRAWAFQETLLAPRLLIYNSETLRWWCRCRELNLGASITPVVDPEYFILYTAKWFHAMCEGHSVNPPKASWEQVVTRYSGRELSDPNDRLLALGAIAKILFESRATLFQAERKEFKYVAGLWNHQLSNQLLWFTDFNRLALPEPLISCKLPRPPIYRAPSWSWASIDGPISFEDTGDWLQGATVVECSTTLKSNAAPFGAVRDGWLVIEGPMLRARYKPTPYTEQGDGIAEKFLVELIAEKETSLEHYSMDEFTSGTSSWDLKFDTDDEPLEADADFLMLKSHRETGWEGAWYVTHGLILRDLHNGNHVRVGIFHCGTGEEGGKNAEMRLPPVRRVKII